MRLAVNCNPSAQMPLQGIPAGPGLSSLPGAREGQLGARERVTIDLRGLGPQLKIYAAARGKTPAGAIRLALVQALDSEPAEDRHDPNGMQVIAITTKITLRITANHAAQLARRARASEVSQGTYVSALLDCDCPAHLPASHDAAIQALMASTDRLAVLSADLNGFMRAVGHLPSAEFQRYRSSVLAVVDDVRKHLAQASALIAEIRPARRGRR